MTPLVVGVDGGASKTVALVADREGRVLGTGRAGNADIYQTPDAVAHVAAALAQALNAAGARQADVDAAALSLVGADWPEDFAHWRQALPDLGLAHLPPTRVTIVNDALGALAAGAPDGPALAIVLGTGCAVGARGPDGRTWHSSFWQRTQGAGEIGERALDAVYLAHLGSAPPTDLTGLALAHYDVPDVRGLLHAFTARPGQVARPARSGTITPASFVPYVLDAAEGGDAVAAALVDAHAEAVARSGVAAAAQVGLGDRARLVLAGGVLRHPSRRIASALVRHLRGVIPALEVIERPPEPVFGALGLALGSAGVPVDDALRHRLVTASLPAGLFRTRLASGDPDARRPAT